MNFVELRKAEVHADVKVCIAPPRSARAAGEGMPLQLTLSFWCTWPQTGVARPLVPRRRRVRERVRASGGAKGKAGRLM
jgi:hypothetical protein